MKINIYLASIVIISLAYIAASASADIPKSVQGEIKSTINPPIGWSPIHVLTADKSEISLLQNALSSKDKNARRRSAFYLGQIGNKDSIGLLSAHISDPDKDVRIQCGIALACLGDSRGAKACTYALRNTPEWWIRYYAVYGLSCINSPEAKSTLRAASAGQKEFIQEAIRKALETKDEDMRKPIPTASSIHDDNPASLDDLWIKASNSLIREADAWFHYGEYDQTIRAQEASILFDPKDINLYATNAWLLWSMGRIKEADETLHRGIATAPNDPQPHFELGQHLYNTGRYEMARHELKTSVNLGGNMPANHMYAHCLEQLGKLDEALEQWKKTLKKYPDDGAARHGIDRVLELKKVKRAEPTKQ